MQSHGFINNEPEGDLMFSGFLITPFWKVFGAKYTILLPPPAAPHTKKKNAGIATKTKGIEKNLVWAKLAK